MRALVVYESMFGNTRNVALAIAEGVGSRMPVETLEVGSAPTTLPSDVALLVVGGPTHVHGMSTTKTRTDAAIRADGPVLSNRLGMREWLARLRSEVAVTAVAFDTRTPGPTLLTGSAASGATRLLRKAGIGHVEHAHSFVLDGVRGPLADRVAPDVLATAREWGAGLAATLAKPAGMGTAGSV